MNSIDNKTIMITGGTGSFGNAFISLAEQYDVKIIVFSRDEKKQHDMYTSKSNNRIKYIVGDVRNKDSLNKAIKNVDVIFHAAALKHVPTGEHFPMEVINTNVIGTNNVIEIAEKNNVETVINLSTDKAVKPVNAYGMSKALSEKIINAHEGNTKCINLRYGNVLGSRGSVIPLFIKQIENHTPLTITYGKMTRFLLPLPNAVKLSLNCIKKGDNGDLFVIKSPACTIDTLVEAFEMHYNKKIDKTYIGIRPGEKIHEELLTIEELNRSEEFKDKDNIYIKVSKCIANIDDYYFSGRKMKYSVPYTSENTMRYDSHQTLELLYDSNILVRE